MLGEAMQPITRRQFGAAALSAAAYVTLGLTGCTDKNTSTGTSTSAGSAAASGSAAVVATTPASADTLRVGCRADVVGFGYLNERTGKYYGLEIDIAEELASRIGKAKVTFTTTEPENRKELLLNGSIDCLIACYSIADTRKENFDFSPAYYDDAIIAVVQDTSNIESISDLKGLTFGTLSGANAAPLLSAKLAKIGFSAGEVKSANEDNTDVQFDTWHLLQFSSYQELSDALEVGEVDAMVLDGAIAKTYLNDGRHILDNFTVEEIQYGVATQKGSELSEPIASAIQEMLDDGTISELIDKWN